jgi:ribosomal protein S18 acetylase RimI-like enzyme
MPSRSPNTSLIRSIEELSLNAWPALQTLLCDGWVLRFANGYTRRANSVIPLYPGRIHLAEKVEQCESIYRDQGMPVIFKLTTAPEHERLEAYLAGRGYSCEAATGVHTLNLGEWKRAPNRTDGLQDPAGAEWQAAFGRMSGLSEQQRDLHQQLLAAIRLPVRMMARVEAGRILGCGLGVLQSGHLGIFDLIIAEGCRRQGIGGQLMAGLLEWGQRQGARLAYLQVMTNNEPALRLYEKLGFREAYRYWYRIRQFDG